MGGNAIKGSALPVVTGLAGSDYVLAVANVSSVINTAIVNTATFFSNTAVPFVTVGNNAVSTANLVVRAAPAVPVNSGSNGVAGQVVWDASAIYVCIANNSWKKATLSTF
jgi:hypothetical protein